MQCSRFLLPFLNVSSLYFRFNVTTNTIMESRACVNYVDLFYPEGDLSFTPFSSELPFYYNKSILYLGKNRDPIDTHPVADFWKRAVPQGEFLEILGDKCPVLARDYLLSTQSYDANRVTSSAPRLILYPSYEVWAFSDPSPTFGTYDCGTGCDGYYIDERGGQIFINAVGDLLEIRYVSNSYNDCGIFGALQGAGASPLHPCYGTCTEEVGDEVSATSLFFSPNLAIYFEFVVIIGILSTLWRYIRRLPAISEPKLSSTTAVSFNSGTWFVIYILFGVFLSIVSVIIGQGVDYLGNLLFTTLPLILILPLFMLQLARSFARYTKTFPSRLTILSYVMLAALPVWAFATLDHPMLLNGKIQDVFDSSPSAGILFFLCLPFGVESLINYRMIRRGVVTSFHLKYSAGFVYGIFFTSLLLFTVSALRDFDFYVQIFDSLLSVFGFFMLFIGEGAVEDGAAAMGSIVSTFSWTFALFSQPIFSTDPASIVHWVIMVGLLVYTNYKKEVSEQTKSVNTYLSVSFAARVTSRVATELLTFSAILQSLAVAGVSFGVLYLVQFYDSGDKKPA